MNRFILPPLRDYQTELVRDNGAPLCCLSATQIGKTFAYGCKLLAYMWPYKGPHHWWWCAPTYKQSAAGQQVMYQIATSAGIMRSGPKPPFDNPTPKPMVLINGAVCEYRTWADPSNLMGHPIAGGVVDEAGLLTDTASSYISTRRSYTLGPLWYIGNPGPIDGPFARLCDEAETNGSFYRWTWRDLHAWLEKTDPERAAAYLAHIDSERRLFPRKEFQRLYEAEWADWNDLPVYTFERHRHVSEDAEYDPHLPILLSCDFNVDPMAWTLAQSKGDVGWTFDEIVIPGGATTEAACDEFIRRHPNPKNEIVIDGDRSGKSRDTKSKLTDYKQILQRFQSHYLNVRMEVPNSNPAVAGRVNAVNAMLDNGRMLIHPRCKTLIDDRARVAWKPGTREIDKRDKNRTHASDADDYRWARMFPVQAAESDVFVGAPPAYVSQADPFLSERF